MYTCCVCKKLLAYIHGLCCVYQKLPAYIYIYVVMCVPKACCSHAHVMCSKSFLLTYTCDVFTRILCSYTHVVMCVPKASCLCTYRVYQKILACVRRLWYVYQQHLAYIHRLWYVHHKLLACTHTYCDVCFVLAHMYRGISTKSFLPAHIFW